MNHSFSKNMHDELKLLKSTYHGIWVDHFEIYKLANYEFFLYKHL